MMTETHDGCGGTILTGGSGDERHRYCDRCRAFTHDLACVGFPTGRDPVANGWAWDDGELSSPEGEENEDA
jgi:hypothetical protein